MRNRIILSLSLILLLFGLGHYDQSILPKKQPSMDLPQGRDAWRLRIRGGNIDPAQVLHAREQIRGLYQRARVQRDGGLKNWEFKGPHSVGGRVRAIGIHPSNGNILYCGGVSGGLYKSTNTGATWTALDDFLPSLSITSIIIKPNNPNVLYAATGEGITASGSISSSSPGAGIFKSTNAGDTWDLIPALHPDSLDGFYWVNDLAFHPTNPSIFYAVGQGTNGPNPTRDSARLYKFSFDGAVKEEISSLPNDATAYSIYINPNDADHIMVGHRDGLHISWDGGNSWMSDYQLTDFPAFPSRVEVGMSVSNDSVVYALCAGSATGTLAISTDKGMTWNTQLNGLAIFTNSIGNAGTYHNTIWVDPEDVDNLILGGINLWRSMDGGASITQISDSQDYYLGTSAHADHHIVVEATQYDGTTNPKLYFGNDGGIARTNNWKTVTENLGWESLINGLDITQFYASDIDGNNPDEIIAGSQDNGTWYTDDSGATWERVGGGDGGYCGLNKQGGDPNYVSSQFGEIKVFAPPLTFSIPYWFLDSVETNPPFIAVMKIYPNYAEKILVGGESLWQVTSTPNAIHQDVSPRAENGEIITALDIAEDSSHIAVGYSSGELYINSSGVSGQWAQKTLPVTGTITDVAFHPTNSNRIIVTLGKYRDDNVWYTEDGGTTWNERSNGIPPLHINSITWHPDADNWVYVGTDMGVMASEDNGQNWNVTPGKGKNDGPVMVEVTNVQFSRNNTFGDHVLVATTYGRGIWQTTETVLDHIYIDPDCSPCGQGTPSIPYEKVEDAEDRQAHGQTWHFEPETYTITEPITITKRLNKVKINNQGTVIIK